MKTETHIKTLPIGVFFALVVVIAVILWTTPQDETIVEIDPVEQDRVYRLEKAYLAAKAQIIELEQKVSDYEAIIQDLMEEKMSNSAFKSLEFMRKIEQQNFAYNNRIKPTLAQVNQIRSWLDVNIDNDNANLDDYIKAEVFDGEQYEAYVRYKYDIAYAERLELLASLIRAIKFEDDTLEEIYNHEYASNEEAIENILTQEQYAQWVQYNQ